MTNSLSPQDMKLDSEPDVWRDPWFLRLMQRLGLRSRDSVRDDLEDALAETAESDEFTPLERAMLKNVLNLREVRVDDVMVPRADIIAAPLDISLGELLCLFRTAGHSRLPVYGETLDDPKGMVHIRDVLDHLVARAEALSGSNEEKGAIQNLGGIDLNLSLATAKILRPTLYAPPSMPAIDLLVKMQATRTHMALIIDEYGGTDGLASIEDLVEMIVGDIEDEHDDASAAMVIQTAEDVFVADARATIEEVETALGLPIADPELAQELDTLAGLIVTLAGRVPSRGELIAGPETLEFEVLDADPRRLKRIRIHRRSPEPAEPPAIETLPAS